MERFQSFMVEGAVHTVNASGSGETARGGCDLIKKLTM